MPDDHSAFVQDRKTFLGVILDTLVAVPRVDEDEVGFPSLEEFREVDRKRVAIETFDLRFLLGTGETKRLALFRLDEGDVACGDARDAAGARDVIELIDEKGAPAQSVKELLLISPSA